MDFRELISVASNKQKAKEKELVTNKSGFNTHLSTPKTSVTSKPVDDVKRKKLEAIRARVEAQSKGGNNQAQPGKKKDEEIMDFTTTGLSENDIRRKKLSQAEILRKREEFLEKLQRLKDNPVGKNEKQFKGVKSLKEENEEARKEKEKWMPIRDLEKPIDDKEFICDEKPSKSSDRQKHHKHKKHKKHKSKDIDRPSSSDKHSSSKSSKHSSDSSKHKSSKIAKPKYEYNEKDIVSVKKPEVAQPEVKKPIVKKKKKIRPQMPPPLSFNDILDVANKNKDNPKALLAAALPEKPKKKKSEPDRPMTQEEKDRYERKHSVEYQKWIKEGGQRPDHLTPLSKRKGTGRFMSREFGNGETQSSEEDEEEEPQRPAPQKPTNQVQAQRPTSQKPANKVQNGQSRGPDSTKSAGLPKPSQDKPGLSVRPGNSLKSEHVKKINGQQTKAPVRAPYLPPSKTSSDVHKSQSANKSSVGSKSENRGKPKPSQKTASGQYDVTHETVLQCGNSSSPSVGFRDSKKPSTKPLTKPLAKPSAKPSVKPSAKPVKREQSPPSNPWDRIYGQIQKNHPKKEKRKQNVIESDEESDLDGFIDDDEDDDFIDDSEAMDYSKHIAAIFGYNKNKYRHIDEDDLSDMETGYAQQMKEEIRSAKIGLQEDLEDIRKEEEELKRKKLMLQKKKQAAKKLKTR